MLVQEVMTVPVVTIEPSATIGEAAKLMLDHRISGLPVVDADGALIGIISEGDFLRRSELKTEGKAPSWWKEFFMRTGKSAEDYIRTHGRTVEDIMTSEPVTTSRNTKLSDAVDVMERNNVKRLPVVENGKLVGILARADLMRIIAKSYASKSPGKVLDDETIRQAVMGELAAQPWSGQGLIHVDVNDGIVDLTGTVYSDSARAAARIAAENVEGVKAVNDKLEWVEPTSGMVVMP